MTSEVNDQAHHHDPVYDDIHASPEFSELRRRYRRFAFPATVAFLAWYLLYVVMSNWAHDFMSTQVVGHVNVALVFGLLQFLTTFLIAWFYASYMARSVDPIARDLEARWNREAVKGIR